MTEWQHGYACGLVAATLAAIAVEWFRREIKKIYQ